MRTLNKKQKQLLDRWYNQNKDKIQNGICFFDWSDCDLFSLDLYEELVLINDFEVLSQEINRYIQELAGY